MSSKPLGLLVMHYGTPSNLDEVLPYYTHIRRGNPPTPELLEDLVRRYKAIGGPSPLAEISKKQAELIRAGIEKRGFPVHLEIGAKHNHPFVADAVESLARAGVEKTVGIVLAPHYSSYSLPAYAKYAEEAKAKFCPSMELSFVRSWGAMPAFIDAVATRLQVQLEGLNLEKTLVIFSAHSLPVRIMAEGDPYVDELNQTSQLVADKCKIPHWTFAFQSASTTGEAWLGPDVLDAIESNKNAYSTIVCCTVGFVSDHLEVLYDLGIETRERCGELGLEFRQAQVINADETVMDHLAQLCLEAAHLATTCPSS